MTKTDLDWTFSEIPSETEAPPAQRRARPPRPRRKVPRWVVLAGLVLALAAAGGAAAYQFTRTGWQRVRAQIEHEVVYEHERSLAGDVPAVSAMLAGAPGPWHAQRAAEASLGLAAPLPAPNLLPASDPPVVLDVRPESGGVVVATVLRRYTDSAGLPYDFTIEQRYQSSGPGLWNRLPPDESALSETVIWVSPRLTVTLPAADLPWLQAALPIIDAALARACVEWQCPGPTPLQVTFSPQLSDWPAPVLPEHPPDLVALGGLPLIFHMPAGTVREGSVLVLPSPHLTGYPHDEFAAEALARTTASRLLAHLAAQLAGRPRTGHDFFLDALVARAEARYGLSHAAGSLSLAPFDFLPADSLWTAANTNTDAQPPGGVLAWRREALDLVNTVLEDEPPEADAALLRSLREHTSITRWLGEALGARAQARVGAWHALFVSRQVTASPPDWRALDGLMLSCPNTLGVVRNGRLDRLTLTLSASAWLPAARSLDGRYLAVLVLADGPNAVLMVADLVERTFTPLPDQEVIMVLGWSANGQLVYGAIHPEQDDLPVPAYLLRYYDPATTRSYSLLAAPVLLPNDTQTVWLPDREYLVLPAVVDVNGRQVFAEPTLVQPTQPIVLQRLGGRGYGTAAAPNGTQLALFRDAYLAESNLPPSWRLDVVGLNGAPSATLLRRGDLPGQVVKATDLHWSPDGQWLSFVSWDLNTAGFFNLNFVRGDGSGLQVVRLDDANALYPVGFSADSRYFAVMTTSGLNVARAGLQPDQVTVLPVGEWRSPLPAAFHGTSAVWSPSGHLLALAGAAGVYVVDPVTLEYTWLTSEPCALSWSNGPRPDARARSLP